MSHALLLMCSGNESVVFTSIVRRAISNIHSRCSKKYAAINPEASSLTASFHESFADFKCLAARSRLAIWSSCKVLREKSNSNSGFGISTESFLSNQYFEKPRVLSIFKLSGQSVFEFCSEFQASARPCGKEDMAMALTKSERLRLRVDEEMANLIRHSADEDFRTFEGQARYLLALGLKQRDAIAKKVQDDEVRPEPSRSVHSRSALSQSEPITGRAIPLRRRTNVERRWISQRQVRP